MYTFSSVPSEGNSRRSYIRSGKSWNTTQRVNTNIYAGLLRLQTVTRCISSNQIIGISLAILNVSILPSSRSTNSNTSQCVNHLVVTIDLHINSTSQIRAIDSLCRCSECEVSLKSAFCTRSSSEVCNSSRSSSLRSEFDSQSLNTQIQLVCIWDSVNCKVILTVFSRCECAFNILKVTEFHINRSNNLLSQTFNSSSLTSLHLKSLRIACTALGIYNDIIGLTSLQVEGKSNQIVVSSIWFIVRIVSTIRWVPNPCLTISIVINNSEQIQ